MPYQKIGNFKMKLTPREKDKLLISMAAEVARKRLERGVKLNYPEAIAIIFFTLVNTYQLPVYVILKNFMKSFCIVHHSQ